MKYFLQRYCRIDQIIYAYPPSFLKLQIEHQGVMGVRAWPALLLFLKGLVVFDQAFGGGKIVLLSQIFAGILKFVDNFIFVDFLHDSDDDGFNDDDIYGEVYFNFSLRKILDTKKGGGSIKDIGILAGLNIGLDSKVVKYLPGIQISWDVEGFAFLNTDIAFYIDGSSGLSSGGVPKEDNTFFIDVN